MLRYLLKDTTSARPTHTPGAPPPEGQNPSILGTPDSDLKFDNKSNLESDPRPPVRPPDSASKVIAAGDNNGTAHHESAQQANHWQIRLPHEKHNSMDQTNMQNSPLLDRPHPQTTHLAADIFLPPGSVPPTPWAPPSQIPMEVTNARSTQRADPSSSDEDDNRPIGHNDEDDKPRIIGLFPTEPAADRPSYTFSLRLTNYWIQSMAIIIMITQELTSVGRYLILRAANGRTTGKGLSKLAPRWYSAPQGRVGKRFIGIYINEL